MFNIFSKTDLTPVEMYSEAIGKVDDLKSDIADLKEQIDKTERTVQALLVSDAFGDKTAEAKADAETAVLMKAQRKLESKQIALEAIQNELPNLEAGKLAFEREEHEQTIKDAAVKRLKALPAMKKKVEKAQAEYVKAMAEYAALSRPAASVMEAETEKALRIEYNAWGGFDRITEDYYYLSPQERAEFNLRDIAERGSDAVLPEKSHQPTAAEQAEAHRRAITAHTRRQAQQNSEHRKHFTTIDAS